MKTHTQTPIETRELANVRGGFDPLTVPNDEFPWFMPQFWWNGSLLDRIQEMLRPRHISLE
jgi:hypothetical protein